MMPLSSTSVTVYIKYISYNLISRNLLIGPTLRIRESETDHVENLGITKALSGGSGREWGNEYWTIIRKINSSCNYVNRIIPRMIAYLPSKARYKIFKIFTSGSVGKYRQLVFLSSGNVQYRYLVCFTTKEKIKIPKFMFWKTTLLILKFTVIYQGVESRFFSSNSSLSFFRRRFTRRRFSRERKPASDMSRRAWWNGDCGGLYSRGCAGVHWKL